jgi:hypothetical protein
MSESGGITLTSPSTGGAGAPVSATSGNVANAAATATLPAAVGKTTVLDGFAVTGLGATAAATLDVTITGPVNTIHYAFTVPAGVATEAFPLTVELPTPIPAAAANTAVVVNLPAFGAGNTNASVSAHGRQV